MPKFWWPDLMVMILKDPRTMYTVAELMELTGERHSPNMSRVMRHMERLGLVSGEKFRRGPRNHLYMKYRKLYRLVPDTTPTVQIRYYPQEVGTLGADPPGREDKRDRPIP